MYKNKRCWKPGINTFAVSLSLVLICGFLALSCEESKERPNILFIMSDDHASAAISSYGSQIMDTPNIDRIAERGVRFTNAFVTSSLCAPSRAAILTGKYGERSGFRKIGDVFDGSQQTFPKLLQKEGYQTAIFGKWHLGSQPTGFNYYEVVRGQGLFFNPSFYKTGMEWNEDWQSVKVNDEGIVSSGYFTDIVTDKSIGWLEERKGDDPFALFVHHKAPHSPHITPEEYDSLFTRDIPTPDTFNDTFEGKNTFIKDGKAPFSKIEHAGPYDIINSRDDWDKVFQGEYEPPLERGTEQYKEWAFQTMFKGYYRQVSSMDDNIGRLLDYLEETGLDENTLVVYVSDNGWFLGDHGLYNKMWMYEESLKVPLIISYSDHFSGNRVEESIVSILDFAPTFLDYADIKIPSPMQGRSLKPILENNKPSNWRTSFYYHYYNQFQVPEHYGIRTKDYKLIKFVDSTQTKKEYELYDLSKDPKEMDNMFDKLQNGEIQDSLMQKLERQKIKFES